MRCCWIAIVAVTILAIAGCADRCPTEDSTEPTSPMLAFGRVYLNWAWAYQHHGWYIDYTGTVSSFSYSVDDSMWYVEEDGLITLDELERIGALSDPTGRVVSDDTLFAMLKLSGPASRVPEPQPEHAGADAGVWSYAAYIWDDQTDAYRILTLFIGGDLAYETPSPQGRMLYEWLMTFDNIHLSSAGTP